MNITITLLYLLSFLLIWQFVSYTSLMAIVALKPKPKNKDYFFQPFVSIIVPTYNEEERIDRCLKSINDLNYPKEKMEIIVVDDGSQDNTVDIARKSGVSILRQQHLGCAIARNRGVELAKGKIIAFIDADDACKEEWLIETVPYLKDKQIGAVGCSHDLLNAEKRDFVIISHKEKCFRYIMSPDRTDHIGTSGCVIKKKVFLEVGGFNPEFLAAEDTELSHKIRKEGYEIILVKKSLISVTYPNRLSRYFFTQIRNSAFLVYFISTNVERASGNKYSGLHDYVQSIFPTVFILSLLGGLYVISLTILLLIFSLILINTGFLRYLSNHKVELSKFWFISALFYLLVRSVAWNIGLLYGLFLRVSKKIIGGVKE